MGLEQNESRTVTSAIHLVRIGLALVFAALIPASVAAAPFAAFVMDGRTGKEIYSQNADTRLHPASLTKMMTLYIAFEAVERGQVRLDSKFLVSSHAAAQPPSRLGLKPGQRIELRYLIRAAAVKSANDAATTIGEGLAGSEAKFAARMTATARALGMRNTQFKNANGLTATGHFSTARDMTILGRRLFYDYPQYYSIFSRRSADAGIATVRSTNTLFLDGYEGADGIKTGYTRAAGFNLTASAQRGNKRVIASVFGGTSTAHRNSVMAQLLDAGFGRAPNRVNEVKPAPPQYMVEQQPVRRRTIQVTPRIPDQVPAAAPVQMAAVAPTPRPANAGAVPVAVATPEPPTARPEAVNAALTQAMASAAPVNAPTSGAVTSQRPRPRPGSAIASASTESVPAANPVAAASTAGLTSSARPRPRLEQGSEGPALIATDPAEEEVSFIPTTEAQPETTALLASPAPKRRSDTVILASLDDAQAAQPAATEVVSRSSGKGGRYSITLGTFKSQAEADRILLNTALAESSTLEKASRRIANTNRGFQANFTGLSQQAARLTCQRLEARKQECKVLGQ